MTVRVILCSHNGARYIAEQVASIMTQDRPVDVVHLFDFASSDGTRLVLTQLKAHWPKLRIEEVDHAPGVVQSFFYALNSVATECDDNDVIFLSDQDDVWLPQKVAVMLDALIAARTDPALPILAFHDVVLCNAGLSPIRGSFYDNRPFMVPRDLGLPRLLIANPVIGHTIAISKQLLDIAVNCLRPEHYIMHDWALVLLTSQIGRIVTVPQQLGLYRQHEGNVLGAGRRRPLIEYVRRGVRLSAAITNQATAFSRDIRSVQAMPGVVTRGTLFSPRWPIPLQLAASMVWHGHTLGHRLMAIGQLSALLTARHFDRAWHQP